MSDDIVVVACGDQSFLVSANQSLLEGALNAGIDIPSSCRSGLCHTCLVKVNASTIPEKAQAGLSPSQKLQSLALACQLRPTTNLEIVLGHGVQKHSATVVSHDMLNENVLRIRLETDLPWYAGQYLSLWKNQSISRSYSIASLPSSGLIECHVRVYEQGQVSAWLKNSVGVESKIEISTPIGNCFYTDDMAGKSILLVGYGTGLAPLYGIARDALFKQHQGPLYLYHCARNTDQFYYVDELTELKQSYSNFHYESLAVTGDDSKAVFTGIKNHILNTHPKLQDWCVFLCGAPDLVKMLHRACFLNGASLYDIHADPFIPAH